MWAEIQEGEHWSKLTEGEKEMVKKGWTRRPDGQ
jgi:hypothetical protein